MAVTGPVSKGNPERDPLEDRSKGLRPDPGAQPARLSAAFWGPGACSIDCEHNYNPESVLWAHCDENIGTLRALGNWQCNAPGNQCRRLGCSSNCAFWLCDKIL
ncbi:hypothetical protein CTA1_3632 [Colletotrichum tanaceti]|uniref:Uncharacterized protein n=1 Tax=Colletotrichum tanaceti TaxID=1306861 RepID=A0A4U6XDH2_9PEZI|nr:hypothetical protein CTA1_3632 [Colletotrichum tanaceti]